MKTLDDALEMRRRVLLAFEAAERERDPATQRRLLTFVIVGGGPTGVELAGALAEIARQSLAQDFRSIRPESARIVLVEGSPHVLPPFPGSVARLGARDRWTRLGVEVRTGAVVTAVDDEAWRDQRCAASATTSVSPPRPCSGRQASPRRRSRSRWVCRWIGPDASSPSRRWRVPGHPEIFVVGDICALQQDGKPLPGVAQVAMQQGRARGAQRPARDRRRSARAVPLQGLRHDGHHRPRVGGRRHLRAEGDRVSGVALLDLPAHLLADRFSQPHRRHDRMGVCVS